MSKYRYPTCPVLRDPIESCIEVTNLPCPEETKRKKFMKVIKKIFSEIGSIKNCEFLFEEGKGIFWAQYEAPQCAYDAIYSYNGTGIGTENKMNVSFPSTKKINALNIKKYLSKEINNLKEINDQELQNELLLKSFIFFKNEKIELNSLYINKNNLTNSKEELKLKLKKLAEIEEEYSISIFHSKTDSLFLLNKERNSIKVLILEKDSLKSLFSISFEFPVLGFKISHKGFFLSVFHLDFTSLYCILDGKKIYEITHKYIQNKSNYYNLFDDSVDNHFYLYSKEKENLNFQMENDIEKGKILDKRRLGLIENINANPLNFKFGKNEGIFSFNEFAYLTFLKNPIKHFPNKLGNVNSFFINFTYEKFSLKLIDLKILKIQINKENLVNFINLKENLGNLSKEEISKSQWTDYESYLEENFYENKILYDIKKKKIGKVKSYENPFSEQSSEAFNLLNKIENDKEKNIENDKEKINNIENEKDKEDDNKKEKEKEEKKRKEEDGFYKDKVINEKEKKCESLFDNLYDKYLIKRNKNFLLHVTKSKIGFVTITLHRILKKRKKNKKDFLQKFKNKKNNEKINQNFNNNEISSFDKKNEKKEILNNEIKFKLIYKKSTQMKDFYKFNHSEEILFIHYIFSPKKERLSFSYFECLKDPETYYEQMVRNDKIAFDYEIISIGEKYSVNINFDLNKKLNYLFNGPKNLEKDKKNENFDFEENNKNEEKEENFYPFKNFLNFENEFSDFKSEIEGEENEEEKEEEEQIEIDKEIEEKFIAHKQILRKVYLKEGTKVLILTIKNLVNNLICVKFFRIDQRTNELFELRELRTDNEPKSILSWKLSLENFLLFLGKRSSFLLKFSSDENFNQGNLLQEKDFEELEESKEKGIILYEKINLKENLMQNKIIWDNRGRFFVTAMLKNKSQIGNEDDFSMKVFSNSGRLIFEKKMKKIHEIIDIGRDESSSLFFNDSKEENLVDLGEMNLNEVENSSKIEKISQEHDIKLNRNKVEGIFDDDLFGFEGNKEDGEKIFELTNYSILEL